jgi:hypothetical protein
MGNIGTNVQELEDQRNGLSLALPSVINAGILIKSKKGPVGKSYPITSPNQFKAIYGGDDYPNSRAYLMIKGLFDNLNANEAAPVLEIIRESKPGATGTASSAVIGTGGDTLTLQHAYKGDLSPGVAGDLLSYAIHAGNAGKFYLAIYEDLPTGGRGLVETTPEWDLSTVDSVMASYSGYIKTTLAGNPTIIPSVASRQADDILVTASSGSASVTVVIGAATYALSVPFNTSSAQTARDLAAALTNLNIQASVISVTGDTIRFRGNKAGQVITYNSPTNLSVTNVVAASVGVTYLTGGANPEAASTGEAIGNLAPLKNKSIQYAFSTERDDPSWAMNLEIWCSSTKGDVTGLISTNSGITPTSNFSVYAGLLVAHSFLSGIYNWGWIERESGAGDVLIPLLGHFYGAYYVRNRNLFGGYAHIAPAGVNVSIRGIKKLQYTDELDPSLVTFITRTYGWNVINFVAGYGYVCESSRTFSTLNKYYSVHIRNSKNLIIQATKVGMKPYQQRPNNETTRNSLHYTLRDFCSKRFDEGMFDDEGGFDNNVTIQCDEKNNDRPTRQSRKLVAKIAAYFVEIAEEVNLNIVQLDGNVTVEEN